MLYKSPGVWLNIYAQRFNETSSKKKPAKDFHCWAPTPPMGWNSWDCFGPTVNEAEVKANADYMGKHLKKYRWE